MTAENLDVRLLKFRSRREESPHALADALLAAGRLPEALEVAQTGLVEAEDDCGLLVLEGRAWFEQGDLPQAQAALLRAAKAHPREKDPYRWLAQVLMKRGEPTRAVQVLDRAISIDPQDRALQQARARADRLARIAREADQPAPVPEPYVAPAVMARPSVPAAPPAAAPPLAKTLPPRAAQPSAAPRVSAPAPRVALDTEVSPLHGDDDDEDEVEDEATRAYELPPEIANLLEAERSAAGRGATHIVSTAQSLDSEPAKLPAQTSRAAQTRPPVRAEVAPARERVTGPPALEVQPDPTGPFNLDSEELDEEDDAYSRPTQPPVAAPLFPLDSIEIAADIGIREADRARGSTDPTDRFDAVEPVHARAMDGAALSHEPPTQDFEDSGAATDQPEAPEAVLNVLREQGVFEPSDGSSEPWASKREAPRAGNRLGTSLAVGWTLALMAAGGGYYGWTRFLETRRTDARALIAQAVADAHDGDHERLTAAERRLIQARALDPKSDLAIESLLFVHATRALEDAGGDIGYLRNTIARAERAGAPKGLLLAAQALLFTYDRNPESARRKSTEALKVGANDARVLYLVGRLHQRMGENDAEALLSQAGQKDPELSLAWLGQAEIARQMGRLDEAAQLFEQARGKDHTQLRAELWSVVLGTGSGAAPAQLSKLDALKKRVDHGSVGDKLLWRLARAGLLLESNDLEGARALVREASQIVVQDPELLSLLADRAASSGEHDLAYRAANAATLAAPGNRRYRDALANVLLKRGDGRAVLAALEGLEDQGPWMLTMRARAALLSGSREAAEEAKRTLSAHRQSDAGKDDLDAASLLVRLDLRLGANAESLLSAARTLAQKAKDNPLAQSALGETLLLAGQGEAAVKVLDQARQLGSDDADTYYLLGRAYRLTGNAQQAQQSLERALLIAPSHVQAREALGGLLLDSGDYAGAERMFATLEKERAGTSATLGVIEALLGRGEVDSAKERLGTLSDEKKELPSVRALMARVAIADHHANEAVKLVAPLVAEDSELRTADMLVLYGDALYAADAVDSAAGAYEAALELDDTHPDALIGRAKAAWRAEKLGQVYELLTVAEQALTTRVRPPVVRATLQLTRAKARMLQQQYEPARAELAEAVKVAGVAPEALFWYAETLAKTKSSGATEQYTKYLELDPTGEYAARAKKALAPR